ncbi:MAG TPA: 3-hydroxyacyl-CoA dehydrogenase NAD-binding domain-containing protein [Xanthomonadaceae bacterium]|nr:3-hydroxyacyl-CoA dehydrogenase NAD-binding domain-containing protein [Xanthomonadaceae bacterium]
MTLFHGLRFEHWHSELREDGVLVLSLDRKDSPVNTLGAPVLEELALALERLAIEPVKGLVFRSAKPAGFIAGADIREFTSFTEEAKVREALKRGHDVFDRIAALPFPTCAAIHGHCMGGGTELALACRYRVASSDDSTRIGLPEIKLGIYPGWGGSARLPRLIGAPKALDMMLTGRALRASQARAIGLVDHVADPDALLDAAVKVVRRGHKRPLVQRVTAWATNTWAARQSLAPMITRQVARKAKKAHYPAPFLLIDTWRRHGGNLRAMLKAEQRSVAKLATTATARNLVRVFFLQEKLKGLGAGADHGIRHVHVIGAGVMGGDIAAWCAMRGCTVSLQDREMKFIEPALKRADELYAKRIRNEARRQETRARLSADVEGKGVDQADLVIEAIFENLDAKRQLFADAEPRMKADAILATNTSSIPLDALLQGRKRPQNFIGLHFFNPVPMMPLVEIVRHDGADATVVQRALAFGKAIDKLPVPVAASTGFLVNRILFPYLLEAITLYNEGVPGPVIDKAAKDFGMPMGPIELADQVGLDVAASVGRILAEFLDIDVPAGLEKLLEEGKRGRKDGQGFYTWKEGRVVRPQVDPGYQPPKDLEDRLILPFLNEAVACLHEGVVDDAELLDAGVIFGTGFAPFRGGPIEYIRSVGATSFKARLEVLAERYGRRFSPKKGWDDLA